MCFSLQQSVAFTAVGGLLTAWLLRAKASSKFVTLTAYFTLMEALQLLQYLVIDDCGSKVNQLLTLLGWVHIAFQPYFINMYAFGPPYPALGANLSSAGGQLTYSNLHVVVKRLTLAGAVLMLVKAIPSCFYLLGVTDPSLLYSYLSPRIADALMTNTCVGSEMLCGEKLCSLSGKVHLAWSMPMMGVGYYVTGMSLHFQLGWALAVLFGGAYMRLMAAFVFVSGPLLAELLVWPAGLDARRLEWPATWCLFSMAQVSGALLSEIFMNGIAKGQWTVVAVDKPANGHRVQTKDAKQA